MYCEKHGHWYCQTQIQAKFVLFKIYLDINMCPLSIPLPYASSIKERGKKRLSTKRVPKILRNYAQWKANQSTQTTNLVWCH